MAATAQARAERRDPATMDSGAARVDVGDFWQILPDAPLPALDAAGVKAYRAVDRRSTARKLFARVCGPETLPRLDVINVIAQVTEGHVLRPVQWGVVDWAPASRRAFAVVFEHLGQGPVMPQLSTRISPMNDGDIMRRLLAPAVLTLAHLRRRSVTHRAISPDNVFRGDQEGGLLVLGDCVTRAPGAAQPAAIEPIELMMAHPLARGRGDYPDDLYALGATAMILALGHCPVAAMPERDLLAAKIAQGSFAALQGGARLSLGLREVLKGLLCDNPTERWGLEELEQWLGGVVVRTITASPDAARARPYRFDGEELVGRRALAHAFARKPTAATREISSEHFLRWIDRGLNDSTLAAQVAEALADTARGGSFQASLITRVSTILDPLAPLSLGGLSVMPDGLGPILWDAMRRSDGTTVRNVADILSQGLVRAWFIQAKGDEPASRPFVRLTQLLKHSGPGYGIERCLYELNPHLHCQSAVLEPHYLAATRDILPTLEMLLEGGAKPPPVIDRHIAAFIAARFKKNIDKFLNALADAGGDQFQAELAMLGLYARLQYEFGPERLPAVAAWLARKVEPACKRFHSREIRLRIAGKFDEAAASGNLLRLYEAVTNEPLAREDRAGRLGAAQEYARAKREIARLEAEHNPHSSIENARRLAANISLGAAGAVVTLLIAL